MKQNIKRSQTIPVIGKVGVAIVAADLISGALAIPASALIREFVIPDGFVFSAPLDGGSVLERQAIWVAAMLSALLWPLAMRAFDPGYPSFSVPLMRVGSAALVWLLCASGVVYLIEKEIESRALILIGAFLLLLSAVTIRVIAEKNGKDNPIASVEMPMLDAAAEQSLLRGEPLRISIDRLSSTFARPTIFFGSSSIWIYPSVLSPIERLMKRLFDIFFSVLLLILALPALFAVALAILLLDGRPIFYSDQRAGMFGRAFVLRKFRTMRVGAADERASLWRSSDTTGPAFKIVNDPRVTPLGRLLRRYSLDELPQLFDVLLGRMSLVGPRPAGLDELDRYEDRHRLRLTVRPGVTGLWQVRHREDGSFERRMTDDLEYIRRWTVLLDLQIVLRTIAAVFRGKGA